MKNLKVFKQYNKFIIKTSVFLFFNKIVFIQSKVIHITSLKKGPIKQLCTNVLTLSNEQTAAEFFNLPSFVLFIAFILVSCPFKIEIFLSN